MEYDYNEERNGGYKWHNQRGVKRIIKAGVLPIGEQFGYNMREFYKALGVTIED